MLTLHVVTEEVKTLAKWIGIIVAVIVVIALIVTGIQSLIPKKDELLKTWGKLPQLQFPQSNALRPQTYTVNTLSGSIDGVDGIAQIHPFIEPETNLLALERAYDKVANIGINSAGVPLPNSDILYQWTEIYSPLRTLTANILTFNFSMQSDYVNNEDVIKATSLPTEDGAIAKAKEFFTLTGSFPFDDIDESKTKTSLFSINNGQLVAETKLSVAQVIRVEFFLKDFNNLPMFYPHPPSTTITATIASGASGPQVVAAEFFHGNLDPKFARYPLKTSQQAFEELKLGKGYIAANPAVNNAVTITNVRLGYFQSNEPQPYLFPIIVFEGDNGFFGYVNALLDADLQ